MRIIHSLDLFLPPRILKKGVKLTFLIVAYVFWTSSVIGQAFPFKFNYLTMDEGLSHTDVNDIAQDDMGFMWIATNFGLDRFDGYNLRKFYNSNDPIQNAFRNRIMNIYPDEKGDLWLSTEGGLHRFDPKKETFIDYTLWGSQSSPVLSNIYKPEGDLIYGRLGFTFKIYKISGNQLEEQGVSLPEGIEFYDIQPDRNGVLHFAGNQGLWRLENGNQINPIKVTDLDEPVLHKVFFDKENRMILSTGKTLFLTSPSTSNEIVVTKKVTLEEAESIQGFSVASNGDLWVNSRNGMIRLDSELNFIQKIDTQSTPQSLNTNVSMSSYIDRSDCLWVGTSNGGLNYCDLNQKQFYTMQDIPGLENSLNGNNIKAILENEDDLWIGTNANGLNLYDLKTQEFTYFNTKSSTVKLKTDEISSLALDDEKNLWIGSAKGIEILKADKSGLLKPAGFDQFPDYRIYTIAKDFYGNIWFGNFENFGSIWKDESGKFQIKNYEEGYFIFPDPKKPQLLVSGRHGLKRVLIDEKGNITKTFNYMASDTEGALSSDYVTAISQQNDSTYWVGTIGGGVNQFKLDPETNKYSFQNFKDQSGDFNDVESVEIDDNGNIWLGGNGLERINPKTTEVIRFNKDDGLQGNSFKVAVSHKGADGKLYFGGTNGLNYFYPEQIKTNTIQAKPVLTDILINNKRPSFSSEDSLQNNIKHAIGYDENLTLNYLQNNFVISFSSMHYANPLKSQYRYRLEGFDQGWNYTDGRRPTASYNNLDYGSYNLIVQASNNDGVWSDDSTELEIVVTPPWWNSKLANFIYLLIVISIVVGIYLYQARWYRLKREMEIRVINEKKKEELFSRREELYQQQLTFFTNISHEFRTPLTLIIGPLENLMKQNRNKAIDYSYQVMLRNSKRLFNLISELMNFRKVSENMIKLQVEKLDIEKFCLDLSKEFKPIAYRKEIDFQFINRTNHTQQGYFDLPIIEKVLLNLLNNSFKYTGTGGKVEFEIFDDFENFTPAFSSGFNLVNESYRAKNYLYFRVYDSGIGISKETITHIFDRFYRVSSDHLGSGIGLALVKSLTQVHKGDIYVYSERQEGTEIIIGIPCGAEDYSASEKANNKVVQEVRLEAVDNYEEMFYTERIQQETEKSSPSDRSILIVEDNEELRNFLKQTFDKTYTVYQAENGEIALELAKEKVPDLIISDVMMPGMNGIELCKALKESFETSHIPFIILSAKDAIAAKIEGMESGADYYFSKPLSINLLSLTVQNIFEQIEKLKLKFRNEDYAEATQLVHSEKDKLFIQKLLDLIEENIENTELDVDFLCKHMHTSRTKLYQKIKSITDQSVADFVRTIRLKKAIEIMTHEDIALNKVVERIGLQSSSNFSKIFKKKYGKSPLQFMQSLRDNHSSKQD